MSRTRIPVRFGRMLVTLGVIAFSVVLCSRPVALCRSLMRFGSLRMTLLRYCNSSYAFVDSGMLIQPIDRSLHEI